ncbi:hypothetical protein D0C28_11280 [Rhizobium sp. AU243]|nr:hypothetical protein D0C28_11280 [Rhizobium sp. AU243]
MVQASPSQSESVCRNDNPPSFLCLSQESSRRASARRESPSSPRTWAGWIPVTSTGMREVEQVAIAIITPPPARNG